MYRYAYKFRSERSGIVSYRFIHRKVMEFEETSSFLPHPLQIAPSTQNNSSAPPPLTSSSSALPIPFPGSFEVLSRKEVGRTSRLPLLPVKQLLTPVSFNCRQIILEISFSTSNYFRKLALFRFEYNSCPMRGVGLVCQRSSSE